MLSERLAIEMEEVVLTGPGVWLVVGLSREGRAGRGGRAGLVADDGADLGQVGLVSLGLGSPQWESFKAV